MDYSASAGGRGGWRRPCTGRRPFGVGDPGWPRPRWHTAGDLDEAGRVLPAPWIAQFDPARGWSPAGYDPKRVTAMLARDLCQVCGRPRGVVNPRWPQGDGLVWLRAALESP